jgi:hypothetical protein
MNGKGKGVSADLTSPEAQNQTDGALFWKIAQGKAPMPSFADTLTAHQGWDLVNYIRTLASDSRFTDVPAGGGPGSMMQGGMGGGMMMQQGAGPMGGAGCPGCSAVYDALMHECVTATSDGGVVVAVAGKLIRYDSALKKVAESDLDVDWTAVHRRILQIMQDCQMAQANPSSPAASRTEVQPAREPQPGQP